MRAMGPTYKFLLKLHDEAEARLAQNKCDYICECEDCQGAIEEAREAVDHLWAALNCWSCFGEE